MELSYSRYEVVQMAGGSRRSTMKALATLVLRGFLALALAAGVAACDTRTDPEGLPSPDETSLPGVTYSGGPTPTGDASSD
jgi:hypothetical protein